MTQGDTEIIRHPTVTNFLVNLGTKVTNDVGDAKKPENDCLRTYKMTGLRLDFFYFIVRDAFSHFSTIIRHQRHLVPRLQIIRHLLGFFGYVHHRFVTLPSPEACNDA